MFVAKLDNTLQEETESRTSAKFWLLFVSIVLDAVQFNQQERLFQSQIRQSIGFTEQIEEDRSKFNTDHGTQIMNATLNHPAIQ